MPTGYTADIKSGITFEQYAMNCARAFGALISMRDDSSDAEIPEKFEPSTYHSERLIEAHEELALLNCIDDSEAERRASEKWEKDEANRIVRLGESRQLISDYKSMLAKAKAWEPPTEDHVGLHTFMCEQLEKSIDFDDMEDSYNKPAPQITGKEWLAQAIEKAKHNIEYHTKGNNEEAARTNERNLWVSKLRESLKP